MKNIEKNQAIDLRKQGLSINEISKQLGVAKSSVSIWVRDVVLTNEQRVALSAIPFTSEAIEKRRQTRIYNEQIKRDDIVLGASKQIHLISKNELRLIGTSLYWAEGGKTRRLVRFTNSDPRMIILIMRFFRSVCNVPESKFRGYIHIHPHLDHINAEIYWSKLTDIPLCQFFKTYRKINTSSKNLKDSLPNGTLDIYVMDSRLFLKITGWINGILRKF